MTFEQVEQKKAAHKEAQGTWVSPVSLSVMFIVSLIVTVAFNGI